MAYFMAYVQETVQFSPSIPVILPCYAHTGALHINGILISEDTEIDANPFSIDCDERVFGTYSDVFNSER